MKSDLIVMDDDHIARRLILIRDFLFLDGPHDSVLVYTKQSGDFVTELNTDGNLLLCGIEVNSEMFLLSTQKRNMYLFKFENFERVDYFKTTHGSALSLIIIPDTPLIMMGCNGGRIDSYNIET
jgi:predicted NUDIX family NTP pyrophosphohydrolase